MQVDLKPKMEVYFTSWKQKDFTTFRSLLADDATFRGPLGEASNAEECVAGITGMAEMIEDIVINKMVADGADVITWYELHTKDGKILATANWSHFEDGKITKILARFDPRPLI